MTVQVISKVCDCCKGYRSAHDLKCGHCRSKQEKRKLVQCHLTATFEWSLYNEHGYLDFNHGD